MARLWSSAMFSAGHGGGATSEVGQGGWEMALFESGAPPQKISRGGAWHRAITEWPRPKLISPLAPTSGGSSPGEPLGS